MNYFESNFPSIIFAMFFVITKQIRPMNIIRIIKELNEKISIL
jgi:hypothetical protein